jgi:hypothetical protein
MNRALLLLLPLALASLAGCGSGVVELTHDEYARLPNEYRLELFDAENDLVIARNRQDEAEDERAAAERAERDLADTWKRTTKRLNASGQSAKVSRAQQVYDLRIAYVASEIDVANGAIRAAEVETDLRRARLDLVRQRQAARIGRATVASIKPLEDNVKVYEGKLKTAAAAEIALRTKVQAQLNAWKVAEESYATSASDYDTNVWDE